MGLVGLNPSRGPLSSVDCRVGRAWIGGSGQADRPYREEAKHAFSWLSLSGPTDLVELNQWLSSLVDLQGSFRASITHVPGSFGNFFVGSRRFLPIAAQADPAFRSSIRLSGPLVFSIVNSEHFRRNRAQIRGGL